MRTLIASAALALLSLSHLSAGRLDVAVIQFPEAKTYEELQAAFSRVQLFEVTDADRTRTKESYLKGGYVVFAQSLPASPGTSYSNSTRIQNQRADVSFRLGSSQLDFSVTMTEGIKAGLRSIQKKTYSGNASLTPGVPGILSMRIVKGSAPLVTKGQAEMKGYNFVTVVAAQYTP